MSEAPEQTDLEDLEQFAARLALDAGNMAADSFRQDLTVEYKGANRRDPVTEVDRRVEDYLRDAIGSRFPIHRILGEERPDVGPADSDWIWAIDPIDGTVNFAGGLPIFAVSLGLLHRGQPVVAALYLSEGIGLSPGVMRARRGGGAFAGDLRLAAYGEPTLHPSHPAALPAAFWWRFRFLGALRRSTIEVRTLGSIASELGMIAAGALQFGAYRAPRLWDVAAGVLLVREAGGAVYSYDRRLSAWLPFQRFAVPSREGATGTLRDWRAPLLAGGPLVTPIVAANLRPRSDRMRRLLQALFNRF